MPKKDMASERPKNHLKTVNFGNTLLSLELFCSKAEVIYRHVNNELSKKLLTWFNVTNKKMVTFIHFNKIKNNK